MLVTNTIHLMSEKEPRSTKLNKDLLFKVVLVTSFVGISFYLAHHLISSALQFNTFLFESGEFYTDRLLNLSLVKAAQEYGINFFDPFNRQDLIFYQFFPYWVLGALANIFRSHPSVIVNVIQIFLAPMFFIVIYALAKEITGSKRIALLSVWLMFAFGSLEFIITGSTDFTGYGEHAVLMNFLRQIYGFYLDSYALLFGYAAFLFFYRIIKTKDPSFRDTFLFLFFAVLSFNTHFLPTIFFVALFALLLFAKTFSQSTSLSRKRLNLIFVGSFSAIYLLFLFVYNLRLPMIVIVGLAALIFSYFFITSKKRFPYYIFILSLIPPGLYMMINTNIAGSMYNDVVRTKNLYVPVLVLIVSFFPFIVLSLTSIFKAEDALKRNYYVVMLLAIVILVYNNFFGYNNHPYRFIGYVFPLISILAAEGLYKLFAARKQILSLNNVFAVTLTVLIIAGSFANLSRYTIYSHSTSRSVDSLVLRTADAVNKTRKKDNSAVFFVDPNFMSLARLTPYTGAKFYTSSGLAFSSKFQADKADGLIKAVQSGSIENVNKYISSNDMSVKYIISSKKITSSSGNNDHREFGHDEIYIYKTLGRI